MTDDVAGIGQELRSLRLAQDMSGGATFVVDPDLRVVSASGPDLVDAGIDPQALVGQRLDEVLAPDRSSSLIEAYRSALRGTDADLEFVDEASGRLFHVEVRPLRGVDDDVVVGAVARSDDLSVVRAQETHLEHAASLHGLGVSTYDVRTGWRHDARTLTMFGVDDPGLAPDTIVAQTMVTDDRAQVARLWRRLITEGGRSTLSYRVRAAPRAGAPDGGERRIQSTIEAVVGTSGRLLRVVATHVDVTAAAAASAELERARQQVHADRIALVRDLSGVITSSMLTIGDVLGTITDLAVAALQGGAAFAELSPDGTTFERFAVSNDDPETAERMRRMYADPTTRPTPRHLLISPVLVTGQPGTSIDDPDWGVRFEQQVGRPRLPGIEHFIIVPVSHQGRPIGILSLQRPEGGRPYEAGDVDLAQILADRAGAAIIADRAVTAEIRERDRREAESRLLADVRSQRHRLVERLSATESRERRLLAEAVHDEPIQLIAAARLRLMALERRLDKEHHGPDDPSRPSTHEETARIGKILETTMERLRLLIVALSPQDFDDGLVAALGELADATFRGTETVVDCSGPEPLPLSPLQQGAALLIVREALVNARQHANASRVVVRVEVEPSQTVLRVEDDGVGSADIGPRKGHLGMVSMRARAEDAGGQLSVESAVALGTSVVLTFPSDSEPTARS